MNMHWIDWTIVLTLLAFLAFIIISTRTYMQGVADFLAAGRCGGRYLLSISEGIAGLGVVTLLAFWQQYTKTGFTGIWWTLPQWPIIFILALSGWVLYRYRQTRALTMAQFLEMRYTRRFRIYAGVVAFISGIINYGVFPGLNAQLFIYFCGLPEHFMLAGHTVSTFPVVMAVMLSVAIFFTFTGGQIAIMLTNFVQGVVCMVVILLACLILVHQFGWDHITTALAQAPENQSLVNPFKIDDIKGFNKWFFIIQYFLWFYNWKVWQGTQGYNAAAKTPHESRMAQVVGTWRYFAQEMIIPIFAICAIAALCHPGLVTEMTAVKSVIGQMPSEELQSRLTVPLVLSKVLPIGMMGALTAVLLAAAISTDQSYLHSWGSIFVQDVVIPLWKKPLTPKQHMLLLRCSICGVAVFAFFFSLYFSLGEYIRLFFAITGAIYLGGAGICVIGGLYTRWGTALGAWVALTTGLILASCSILFGKIAAANPDIPGAMCTLQTACYRHASLRAAIEWVGASGGQVMAFVTAIACIAIYTLVSLIFGRKKFNLDRMLHRGQYAVQDDVVKGDQGVAAHWRWLGINKEFTRWDKGIYIGSVVWVFMWGILFLAITGYHYLICHISDAAWTSFWHVIMWMSLGLATVVTIWFLIGGLRDLKDMFFLLRTRQRDDSDDGTVRPSENEEMSA